MSARATLHGAVMVAAAVTLLGGCTSAETRKTSAADSIAARQKLMKEQGAAFQSIQGKLKAGQVQAVSADAQKLVMTSRQIPALFPPNSTDPATSRAKPEIWQKWSEFEGLAKSLEAKATQLAATSASGNAQATSTAVADLGKTTCGACHTSFRGPEIKK